MHIRGFSYCYFPAATASHSIPQQVPLCKDNCFYLPIKRTVVPPLHLDPARHQISCYWTEQAFVPPSPVSAHRSACAASQSEMLADVHRHTCNSYYL